MITGLTIKVKVYINNQKVTGWVSESTSSEKRRGGSMQAKRQWIGDSRHLHSRWCYCELYLLMTGRQNGQGLLHYAPFLVIIAQGPKISIKVVPNTSCDFTKDGRMVYDSTKTTKTLRSTPTLTTAQKRVQNLNCRFQRHPKASTKIRTNPVTLTNLLQPKKNNLPF